MTSTAQTPALPATTLPRPKAMVIAFWIVTVLFCLQIGFTAYAQLRLPQVAEAFRHLGFPSYFRVQLSWAKFLGIVVLLAPVPARLKEWAYAGFFITLVSALIAHLSVGDGPEAWGWAAGTLVLWGLSYLFWRRLQPLDARGINPPEAAELRQLRSPGDKPWDRPQICDVSGIDPRASRGAATSS